MRSASPTTSTTIPTNTAITRYAEPVTDCAENTACPSSSLAVTRARAILSIKPHRTGTSYKAKLKAAIDRLIPVSLQPGRFTCPVAAGRYEIKRGKYISARAPDQERFTRLKTLGADYTEEAVAPASPEVPGPPDSPNSAMEGQSAH